MHDDQDAHRHHLEVQDKHTRPPHLIGPNAILESANAETSFLVAQAIPDDAISFIVGVPGSCKSWLAYQLALCVSRGEPWLGRECKRGSVLILSYDNPRAETGRRFKRLGLTADDAINFHAPLDTPAIRIGGKLEDNTEHAQVLRSMVSKLKPDLVVVDSFRQAHLLDENSSNEMGVVMAHIKSWLALGSAVVIVHHATQTDSVAIKARGSGEITASADAIMTVANSELRWAKHRSWAQPESAKIEFAVVDDADSTRVCSARELHNQAQLQTAIEQIQAYSAAGGALTSAAVRKAIKGDVRLIDAALKIVRKGG